MNEEDNQRIGYYSIIPAKILFNKKLKANVKLLYAVITSLTNKEGYCFASNSYLGNKFEVDPKTISSWLKELKTYNYVAIEFIRNEKQEIIQRRIYINDVPYTSNNGYPYTLNDGEGIHQKIEDNNIITNNINTHTEKRIFNKNVFLYDYEYEDLIKEYGIEKTKKCIDELSLYKSSKGIQYVSDYHTIKRWVIIRVNELDKKQSKENIKKSNKTCANFEQRDYTDFDFTKLYANLEV